MSTIVDEIRNIYFIIMQLRLEHVIFSKWNAIFL